MKGRTHNKKRDVGLLYEFLVACVSDALVEGDKKRSSTALKLVKKFFKPGTELYKEFRIANALYRTTVSSEAVAVSILSEAKQAVMGHDVSVLDREKSLLIRHINHRLNDENFFDRQVEGYRSYATIQTLFNLWREKALFESTATYEDAIVKWLVSEKKTNVVTSTLEPRSTGTGRLLMKVLMHKLNEKYSGTLTEAQKNIIRAYAWSRVNNKNDALGDKLLETKQSLVESMRQYAVENPDDSYVMTQLSEARAIIEAETLETIDDDTVTRFMQYMKLNDELRTGNK